MTARPWRRGLLLLALGAAALSAAAQEVRYETRVDRSNRVFVDVENTTRARIYVSSISVVFLDDTERVVDKRSLDCREDCGVGAGKTESFGPIDGPEGWETVRVARVLYEDAEGRRGDSRARDELEPPSARPSAGPAAPRAARTPRAAPTPPPAPDVSTPEAALRAFYVLLHRGDPGRARELLAPSATGNGLVAMTADAFARWAATDTKAFTVTDVRLLAKPDESSPVRAQLTYADGSIATRQVVFVRAGDGFKIERIEPAR